jgi:hypothetical protein
MDPLCGVRIQDRKQQRDAETAGFVPGDFGYLVLTFAVGEIPNSRTTPERRSLCSYPRVSRL